MHPGPTNRGVEIAASVADGEQSVILEQVTYGIAIRMAVMSIIMGNSESFKARHGFPSVAVASASSLNQSGTGMSETDASAANSGAGA